MRASGRVNYGTRDLDGSLCSGFCLSTMFTAVGVVQKYGAFYITGLVHLGASFLTLLWGIVLIKRGQAKKETGRSQQLSRTTAIRTNVAVVTKRCLPTRDLFTRLAGHAVRYFTLGLAFSCTPQERGTRPQTYLDVKPDIHLHRAFGINSPTERATRPLWVAPADWLRVSDLWHAEEIATAAGLTLKPVGMKKPAKEPAYACH